MKNKISTIFKNAIAGTVSPLETVKQLTVLKRTDKKDFTVCLQAYSFENEKEYCDGLCLFGYVNMSVNGHVRGLYGPKDENGEYHKKPNHELTPEELADVEEYNKFKLLLTISN